MFPKILLSFYVLFYYDIVYSFRSANELKKRYENEVLLRGNYKAMVGSCHFTPTWLAAVCGNLFKEIRKENLYQYSLYVNYEAFNYLPLNTCTLKEIGFIQPLRFLFRRVIHQFMMPCFAREAVVTPYTLYDQYEHYNKFFIYPANSTTVMVFEEYLASDGIFTLLEFYDNINLAKIKPVPQSLFTIRPPQGFVDPIKIFTKLKNENLLSYQDQNIIYKMNRFQRIKLCITLYGRSLYKTKVLTSPNAFVYLINDRFWQVCLDNSEGEKRQQHTYGYTCPGYRPATGISKIYDYKVAVGPGNDKVLLLEYQAIRLNRMLCFRVIEFIENLHPIYIDYLI